jgi:hypothetical protein
MRWKIEGKGERKKNRRRGRAKEREGHVGKEEKERKNKEMWWRGYSERGILD